VAGRRMEVLEENGRAAARGRGEERVERLVALGRALSDPIRVRMLGMMAEAARSGRGCCGLPNLGAPASEGDGSICVCEFQEVFAMGQSRVSYHVKKLKDAGLVREEKRGRWSFYALDREAVEGLLGEAARHLGAAAGAPGHG
jgi:ArsR family transcriptional regulator, arsenate/arsenite/antimonite-responsive transcriptional repressor